MGDLIPDHSFHKGPVLHGLDRLSKAPNSRKELMKLARALSDQASGGFADLPLIFDRFLLSPQKLAPDKIKIVRDHFKQHFFTPNASDGYFPNNPHVAAIWGAGLLKTIEASLGGNPNPLPIDAWWIMDSTEVQAITLVSEQQVTLLIYTPRPARLVAPKGAPKVAFQGFTTAQLGVVSREHKSSRS